MEVGLVGLGRKGLGVARLLVAAGHTVFAYDEVEERVVAAEAIGTKNLSSIEELVRMRGPRTVWMLLPAGDVIENVLDYLSGLLTADDIVIDGSGSAPRDSIARQQRLASRSIHVLDAGMRPNAGAPDAGFCLMVGGETEPFRSAEPFLTAVAAPKAFGLVGGPGAGHLARALYARIEDGASSAEVADLADFRAGGREFNLREAARLWQRCAASPASLVDRATQAFGKESEIAAAIAAAARDASGPR